MPGAPRVLVVEDDDVIARGLTQALTNQGYEVTAVDCGAQAMAAASRADLVLLDLGLPDCDGVEVCAELRRTQAELPIVVLTARVGEVETVIGLDAGADDYVAKPFRLAELLARIRARLRHVHDVPSAELASGAITVDLDSQRAFVGQAELDLRPKEYDLLALLVRNEGKALSRTRIMQEVWDEHWWGSTKTLDMHISWLRRKLGDDGERITTLRGTGYRLEQPG